MTVAQFPTQAMDMYVILTRRRSSCRRLPLDIRSIKEAHFFDGDSALKIQRQRQMKRRDVEAIIAATLETMRTSLWRRGVLGLGDVR